MKKTTKKNLSNRLAKYGALTVAIAGVADASGQIIYTDIDPDFSGGGSGSFHLLDLNNDTTTDYVIFGIGAPGVAIYAYSSNPNSFVGEQPAYTYPWALNNGDPISAGQTTWFSAYNNVGTLNYASCYVAGGGGGSNWCGVTDKYLGLRFNIGLNTHYGWARLDVSFAGDSFTIKDYAYNSTPNAPINAGQTLGVEEFGGNIFARITCVDRIVTISQLQGDASFRVISITGQVVKEGTTNLETQDISLETLSGGVYVVEVSDLNSNGVIRKKVAI